MDWEAIKSWLETFKNTGAIAEHTTRMARRRIEKESEKQTPSLREAYKPVSEPGEIKGPLARVGHDWESRVRWQRKPVAHRDGRRAAGLKRRNGPPNLCGTYTPGLEPVEAVGEGWVYMLLMEKYGREKMFCFFQKPA